LTSLIAVSVGCDAIPPDHLFVSSYRRSPTIETNAYMYLKLYFLNL